MTPPPPPHSAGGRETRDLGEGPERNQHSCLCVWIYWWKLQVLERAVGGGGECINIGLTLLILTAIGAVYCKNLFPHRRRSILSVLHSVPAGVRTGDRLSAVRCTNYTELRHTVSSYAALYLFTPHPTYSYGVPYLATLPSTYSCLILYLARPHLILIGTSQLTELSNSSTYASPYFI